jgi:hypothetical protein
MAAGTGDTSKPRVVILGGGHKTFTFTWYCVQEFENHVNIFILYVLCRLSLLHYHQVFFDSVNARMELLLVTEQHHQSS